MRWRKGRRSGNVDDQRGSRPSRRLGAKMGGCGIGMIVLVLAAIYFGVDPSIVLQGMSGGATAPTQQRSDYQPSAQEQEMADFTSVVLADTEDTWNALFPSISENRYEEPKLVLFSGAVQSACGTGQAAMGPFYCPGDKKVYIDLSFYRDLRERHDAPGDFAQAYVIAHEVGHHVQNLLGISRQVHDARARSSKAEGNALSVRQELQADCFAGLWAHHANRARDIIEQGDIQEALRAASMIGDDRLQKQAQGYVVPESFTHGTSEQRMRWFQRGLKSGQTAQCDTFKSARL